MPWIDQYLTLGRVIASRQLAIMAIGTRRE